MNPIIQKIFDQVRSLFIYMPDADQFPGKYDDWKSYAESVEQGHIFIDDCDGFALTCAELLVKNGIAFDAVKIAICETETGDTHLVCIADGYLLDNRQRTIWPWNQVPYRWISSMNLKYPGQWERFSDYTKEKFNE